MKAFFSIIFIFIAVSVTAQDKKNVFLLDQWTDTTLEQGFDGAVYNDVWGFTYQQNNYGVIGSNLGTHVFLIQNKQLNFVAFEPGRYSEKWAEHRDYKTYRNYLYAVCDEGTSSLQIFDMSTLPEGLTKVYDSNEHFTVCHNIYIDTAQAKLYACRPDDIALKVLDISNPIAPVVTHEFNSLAVVHDCYARNDTAFLNAGPDGLYVYDFSYASPLLLGTIDFYADQGYNHSGWWSPNGENYAFIDETKGTKVKLCQWENDLSGISVVETFGTNDFIDYSPHNVILLDNLAFVSYYNEGLRIFDISKAPVEEIGAYDTFDRDTKYKFNGAWGVYVFADEDLILISDRQSGLFLFSFPIGVLNTPSQGTYITSTPFIDDKSILIPRDDLRADGLKFTISSTDGKLVYYQENFLSYVNVPLVLAAGTYVYAIYDEYGEFLEGGKFVKAN